MGFSFFSGTYEKPQHDKASYGTMVYVRQAMVIDAAKWLAQALTISIRYSVVRKQVSKILAGNK
jgi:acyl-CoA oxidase